MIRIHAGDRVTVLGTDGVHRAKSLIEFPFTGHPAFLVTLGCDYGRWHRGDTIPIEAWRCRALPFDLGDVPA